MPWTPKLFWAYYFASPEVIEVKIRHRQTDKSLTQFTCGCVFSSIKFTVSGLSLLAGGQFLAIFEILTVLKLVYKFLLFYRIVCMQSARPTWPTAWWENSKSWVPNIESRWGLSRIQGSRGFLVNTKERTPTTVSCNEWRSTNVTSLRRATR